MRGLLLLGARGLFVGFGLWLGRGRTFARHVRRPRSGGILVAAGF